MEKDKAILDEVLKNLKKKKDEVMETILKKVHSEIKALKLQEGGKRHIGNFLVADFFHSANVTVTRVEDKEDSSCDDFIIKGVVERAGSIEVNIYTNVHFAHANPYSFKYRIVGNSLDLDELLFCQVLYKHFFEEEAPSIKMVVSFREKQAPEYVGYLQEGDLNNPILTECSYRTFSEAYNSAKEKLRQFQKLGLAKEKYSWRVGVKELVSSEGN